MLAHAGGWDEILVVLALVAAAYVYGRIAQRRSRDEDEPESEPKGEPAAASCRYCGARVETEVTRCPSCGLRVRG